MNELYELGDLLAGKTTEEIVQADKEAERIVSRHLRPVSITQQTLAKMAATIYTERLIYDRDEVAARKSVDDAFLIYALVEKRLEEK